MLSSSLQNDLKILDTTPTKFTGKEFVLPKKDLSFYDQFISNFVFYTIQKSTDSSFIEEIDSMISDKYIRFATFSFYFDKNKEFFTICFENFCITILIGNETSKKFAKTILCNFRITKTHFISSNASDYHRLDTFCMEIDEQFEKAIFPNSKEQEEIQNETSQIIYSINKQILQIPIFNISKNSISTFMIRRFYFKSRYFFDWDFFEFKQNSTLKEFKNDEFIHLRDISQNAALAFYKETCHLVVLKYKEEAVNFEEFQKEKNLYEKVNELANFVRCYGFIKNIDNKVIILVLEFMSGGTIHKFIFQKKKIDKYKMSFQILEGLNLLHLNNIIHRDLHPNNIFINHNLDVFIGDFDCSKFYNNSKSLTTDIGSIIYASPEVINSQKYTMSTDIYSYGLVLYFIFTESIPYNSKGYFEIIQMKNDIHFDHFKDEIKDKRIQNIYSRCLQFNQKERPSINDIFDDFIELSFKQYQHNKFKLFCYIITNKSDSIQNKFFLLYNSLLNEKINKLNYSSILFAKNLRMEGKFIKLFFHLVNHNDPYSQRYFESNYIFYQDKYYFNKFIINKYIYYHKISIKYNNFDQYIIDRCYYYNTFLNNKEFVVYIKHFADLNNAKAQYIIGNTYLSSEELQNIEKAIYFLNLSSDQKDPKAQFLLGVIYGYEIFGKFDINKSIYYLKLSFDQGNYNAALYLGILYNEGKYVCADINKAIYYFTISANHYDSEAQYNLGCIYLSHKDVPSNINKAIYYFTLSANQNNPYAAFSLGSMYYYGNYVGIDIKKSIHYLMISVNSDHTEAQRLLSSIYYSGKYVKKDIQKSIYYFTILAKKNEYDAQYNLGYIYYYGIGNKNDIDKSIYYLKKSADQNCLEAQRLLGKIYFEDRLIKRDINKSIYYLNLSANQNDSKSLYLLGVIYFIDTNIEKNINKSIYYFTKSANLNNELSQFMLGKIYKTNKYTQIDVNKSIYYLTLSANNNCREAQQVIGKIYYKGKLISRDMNKSIHYLTLSAEQNDSYAQYLLGEIYYTNKFVPKDIKKSIHYFKEASSFDDPNAKNFLGVIYKNGDGVEKNIYYAIQYFNEAIRKKNCCFSIFNLSRIYYFGIDVDKNINKAIDLLIKASEQNFLYADLFLYFICLFDKSNIPILNGEKMHFYQKIIIEGKINMDKFLDCVEFILEIPYLCDICSNKILSFIRDNDLLITNFLKYDSILIDDFSHSLPKIAIKNNITSPINNDFYDGFRI